MIILTNVQCDWNKVGELLSNIPQDDLEKQRLYLYLSGNNALRTLFKFIDKKLKNIQSQKGFTFDMKSEILAFLTLVTWSSRSSIYSNSMFAVCLHKHNNTLRCLPVLSEAKSKASEDLLEEIDFGGNFISECMHSKTPSIIELGSEIYNNYYLNKENCIRIAEIYREVFDNIKNKEMDIDGKFMILHTFYLITKAFKGYSPLDREVTNEFNDIMKKHIHPEFSDIFESV